jgi:predicted MFS family arabinose efflux permease
MILMKKVNSPKVQTYVLNSASFISQFAISMVNLALVYHLRISFNLSAKMIGFSAALYTGTYFICCLVLEPLTHHMRPRHSVELSVVGMGLSVLAVVLTKDVNVALISLVFYGVFMSFLWPQIESWLARGKEGQELNKATSSFNVSWSLGGALSPLLTGFLAFYTPIYPLVVAISLFVTVYLLIAISTQLFPEIRSVASEKQNISQANLVDQSTPLRFLSWAGILAVYASYAIILTIFPIYALDSLPINQKGVGALLLVRGLTTVIMFIILGKTSWWHFKKNLILTILILVSLLYLAGTKISGFLSYALFFALFGILFAFAYSFSIFHGASGSVHRSKRMLIHEILLTIGTITGSIGGGYFYEAFGYNTVLKASSIFVLMPVLGSLVLTFTKKRG